MKAIGSLCCAALLASASSAAFAQNFTYSSVDSSNKAVGGPDMRGNPVVGTYSTGTSTVTWADGRKSVDTYTCIGTTQPANDRIFDAHTICDAGNADGTYTAIFGCNFTSKDMRSTGCVGGLIGRTGKYVGMGGTITFGGGTGGGTGTGTWAKSGQ